MLKTFLEQTVSILLTQKSCYILGYQVLIGLRVYIAMQCGECQNRALCRELWEYHQHYLPRLGAVNSDWRNLEVLTYSLALFLLLS